MSVSILLSSIICLLAILQSVAQEVDLWTRPSAAMGSTSYNSNTAFSLEQYYDSSSSTRSINNNNNNHHQHQSMETTTRQTLARNKSSSLLIKCFVLSQVIISLFALALMARLWFCPIRLNPLANEPDGQNMITYTLKQEISDYNFTRPVRLTESGQRYSIMSSGEESMSSGGKLTNELDVSRWPGSQISFLRAPVEPSTKKIDKLQLLFNCCGVSNASDWLQTNYKQIWPSQPPDRLTTSASCCQQSFLLSSQTDEQRMNDREPTHVNVFCLFGSLDYGSRDRTSYPSAHQILEPPPPIGCKQALEERETRSMFQLRLQLLLLLAVLFFNILAQMAAFGPASPVGSGSNTVAQF